ncbi:MAG: polysaccharide deacetylase family protein [Mesorhizobium sp.]|nr:MAG: polysaccharide deacetylase family protein [Mesorhizobium sp.]
MTRFYIAGSFLLGTCFGIATLPARADTFELQAPAGNPWVSASCRLNLIADADLDPKAEKMTTDELRVFIEQSFSEFVEMARREQALLREFDAAVADKDNVDELNQIPAYEQLWELKKRQDQLSEQLATIYLSARSELTFLNRVRKAESADVEADRVSRKAALVDDVLLPLLKALARSKTAEIPESRAIQEIRERIQSGLELQSSDTGNNVVDQLEQFPTQQQPHEDNSGEIAPNPPVYEEPQPLRQSPSARPFYCPSPEGRGNITGHQFRDGDWVLTFDDGPHQTRTNRIVSMLSRASLKGTFFWIGNNANRFPNVLRQTLASSMQGGSHSMSHAELPKVGQKQLHQEVNCATEVLSEIANEKLLFFRLPYGAGVRNQSRERIKISDAGLVHVFWNVDSLDWSNSPDNTPQKIFDRVVAQMDKRRGGVILFHDIHEESVDAVRLFVARFGRSPNHRFLNLGDAVDIAESCN